MKLSINKTIVDNMFFKKNVNYSHIFITQQSLCDTINCRWKLSFRDILRRISHIDFKYGSINFHKQRKQPAKYKQLGRVPLTHLLRMHPFSTPFF